MDFEVCTKAPESWARMTIDDVCTRITSGGTPSRRTPEFFINGSVPWVKTQELQDGWIRATEEQITEDAVRNSSAKLLPAKSVLLAMYGATVGQLGVLASPMACNQACCALIVNDEIADFRYVYYLLLQHRAVIKSLATGAAQQNLSAAQIKQFRFAFPDRQAQEQVADVLSGLDNKTELNRRINQTLEAMAQAIFKSWFVDFDPVKAKIAAMQEGCDPLRAAMSVISGKSDAELDALPPEQYDQLAATAELFPDEMDASELGEIPRGWSVGTLSDFASFQNGYAFKTKDWTDSGHPVVKIGNVKPGIIDLSGCSFVAHETVNGLDRFALKRGDLLVGMTGYVGETGLVPALDSVAYLNQRVGCITTVNGVSDIGYPFCLVRDPAYKAYAESKAHGSAQANVSGKNLMDYQAVVPDTGVLKIFNAQVAKIINALLSYHKENQSLAALRDTLLPKLLFGELSVADVKSEVSA